MVTRGRPSTVDNGRIAPVVIPKSGDGMLRYRVVVVAATKIAEDGELIFGHYVGVRLSLDATPSITDTPFEQRCDRRRNLAALVILGNLECFG